MVFDVKNQAMVNLTVQILLIITISGAVYLAKKRNLGRHCTIMRVAVLLQIIAIYSIMLIHHTLGLLVIVIFIHSYETLRDIDQHYIQTNELDGL